MTGIYDRTRFQEATLTVPCCTIHRYLTNTINSVERHKLESGTKMNVGMTDYIIQFRVGDFHLRINCWKSHASRNVYCGTLVGIFNNSRLLIACLLIHALLGQAVCNHKTIKHVEEWGLICCNLLAFLLRNWPKSSFRTDRNLNARHSKCGVPVKRAIIIYATSVGTWHLSRIYFKNLKPYMQVEG